MKLKKGFKRFLYILLSLIAVGLIISYLFFYDTKPVKKVKVLSKIDNYGYELSDNKSKEYKALFKDLEKVLNKKKVNEEDYVNTISKMFIYDFYSLNDKLAKTDVGGTDFVHNDARRDFLEKAEDTLYKYVENNLYGARDQELPQVKSVEVEKTETSPFTYKDKVDDNAYTVSVKWDYTDSSFDDYQKSAILVFVHEDKKLSLVEIRQGE